MKGSPRRHRNAKDNR